VGTVIVDPYRNPRRATAPTRPPGIGPFMTRPHREPIGSLSRFLIASLTVGLAPAACSNTPETVAVIDAAEDTAAPDTIAPADVAEEVALDTADAPPADTYQLADTDAAAPLADPIPPALPPMTAWDATANADVTPDLGCGGITIPVGDALSTRDFKLISLGGATTDVVAGAPVQLFYSNDVQQLASVTTTTSAADSLAPGTFTAMTPSAFIATHVPPIASYLDSYQLDVDTRPAGTIILNVASADRVNLLTTIIGGATFGHAAGTNRYVVRAVDCQQRPLTNVHVSLEVAGVVTSIATPGVSSGVVRSYFDASEIPSQLFPWTSRSGLVAFLEVPAGVSLRLAMWGKLDASSQATAVGTRVLPSLPDAIVTGKLTPYRQP
jgi:hypothetical protein